MTTNDGNINYIGRTFSIQTGQLLFEGQSELNPSMNIHATTLIPSYENVDNTDYTVHLMITNDLRDPRIELTSEPATRPNTNEPLTQSDIIGLLTVGRPREQLSEITGEGTLSQFLLSQAGRFSSQRISSFFEYRVGRLFDLDRVAIEGNLFQLSGAKAPSFTAVKTISPRLTFTYSTTIGESNKQGVRLNYELTPHIYLVTETNERQRYGIDIRYKIKF